MPLYVPDPISLLYQSHVAVVHTGTTAETAIVTIPVPGGVPGPNGRVEFWFSASNTSNGNNKIHRIRVGAAGAGVGGTQLWQVTQTTNFGQTVIGGIANRNSVSSQITLMSPAAGTGIGAFGIAHPTAAIDTSSAWEIVLTGELANSADNITIETSRVMVFYRG